MQNITPAQLIESLQLQLHQKDSYIQLLEKINQQISYTWNPVNVLIAILLGVIGLGAIVAAVLIYMQGREYKKRQEEFFREQSKKHERALKKHAKIMVDKNYEFNELMQQFKNELEKIKQAPDSQKIKELEKKLEELQSKQAELNVSSGIGSHPALNNMTSRGAYNAYRKLINSDYLQKSDDFNSNLNDYM